MDYEPEKWRLSRQEVRSLFDSYEQAVEADASFLLRPNAREKKVLGEDLIQRRGAAIRQARDTNRKFVQLLVDDLPDLCAGPGAIPAPSRPVAEVKMLDNTVPLLPAGSYGSAASVFLHLLRDWSTECHHVVTSTYAPAVAALKAALPKGGEVLLPGAGLGRLALELAAEGFQVEANDASRLFLTVADYFLNRAPEDGVRIFPMAHVFTENWSHDQQYKEICVPAPAPRTFAAAASERAPTGKTPISLVAGDFQKLYSAGGAGHRRFDAIVTCFFIDTATNFVELVDTLDGLLAEGGIWLNVGPLNFKKEARLKLSWDEIISCWEGLGYEFIRKDRIDCDYHLARGEKMYTESYQCPLIVAVKRRAPP